LLAWAASYAREGMGADREKRKLRKLRGGEVGRWGEKER